MSLLFVDGAEHGLLGTVGSGSWDVISELGGSDITVDTSIFKGGVRSYKMVSGNAGSAQCAVSKNAFGGNGVLCLQFRFRKNQNPAISTVIWQGQGTGSSDGFRLVLQSDGTLSIERTSDNTTQDGPVLSNNTWYRIDLLLDASTLTHFFDWYVDGTAQLGLNQSGNLELSCDMSLGIDVLSSGALGSGFTGYFDDILMDDANSLATAAYYIKQFVPNGVGTHNLDAATSLHYFKHDNTTETALTTSETTSHQMIDEVPMALSGADRIQVKRVSGTPTLPSFVSAGAVGANAGTFTPGLPASTVSGDVFILIIESENETACTLSGGNQSWTEIHATGGIGVGTGGATDAVRIQAFWARRGSTAPTMPTVSDSGDHQQARVFAFRDVIAIGNDPIGASNANTESGNSDTSGSANGITTLTANELVCLAVATALPDTADTGAQFTGWTNANLGSPTERGDNTTNAGTGGGLGFMVGSKAAAGATGNTTFTTAQNTAKAMLMFSLKGAVSVTEPTTTWYAEYTVEDSSEANAPSFVALRAVELADSGAGSSLQIQLSIGGAGVLAFGSVPTTTPAHHLGVYEVRPGGGAWTDTDFDNSRIRIGFSGSAAGVPRVESVALDGIYVDASGPVTNEETGSLVASSRFAGVDASERAELGALVTTSRTAGIDASERAELGALVTSTILAAARIRETQKAGAVLASGRLFGADASERAELGSLVTTALLAGGDVSERSELGVLVSTTRISAADVREAAELGALIADTLLAGVSAKEAGARTGALIASARLFGVDASERAELGALVASALLAGADASERPELGALIAAARLFGADASERSEAGALVADTTLAGTDQSERSEAGTLRSNTVISGASVKEAAGRAGAIFAGTLLAGASAEERPKTAALIADTFLAGADVAERSELGSLIAGALFAGTGTKDAGAKAGALLASARLFGADVSERTEFGALIADAAMPGEATFTANLTASLVAATRLSGADVREAVESGLLRAFALQAGLDATERSETALLAARGLLAGADTMTANRLGALIADTLLAGVSVKQGAGKEGFLAAGTRVLGPDFAERAETGALVADTFGSGAKALVVSRSCVLMAGGALYGADAHIAARTGALVGVTNISVASALEFERYGTLMSRAILAGFKQILIGGVDDVEPVILLMGTAIEAGKLTAVGDNDQAVLLAIDTGSARLTALGDDDVALSSTKPEGARTTKVGL